MTRWTIEAVCTGTARPFHGAELSAFAKRPREGAVQIHAAGLAPDEHADRRVHGGPEMALHLYRSTITTGGGGRSAIIPCWMSRAVLLRTSQCAASTSIASISAIGSPVAVR